MAAQPDPARAGAGRAGDPGRRGGRARWSGWRRPGTRAATTSIGLGELYSIHVDPPAWGQGAGRALLAAATAWLDARFPTSILWVVDRNQRARTLYERAGWTLDGATKLETYDGTDVSNCRYRRARAAPR